MNTKRGKKVGAKGLWSDTPSTLDLVGTKRVMWISVGIRSRSGSSGVIRSLSMISTVVVGSFLGEEFVMFIGIGSGDGFVWVVRGWRAESETGIAHVVDGLEGGFIAELRDVAGHDDGAVYRKTPMR